MNGDGIRLVATPTDQELAVTYGQRTWDITAYPVDDFPGSWEVLVHERGTDGPALPAADLGVTEPLFTPWRALAAATEAIVRRSIAASIDWDTPATDEAGAFFDEAGGSDDEVP